MKSLSVVRTPVLRYALTLPFHSGVKIGRYYRFNALILSAKKDRRSSDGSSWKRKRPRKSKNVVVESTPDLVTACNEHIDCFVEDRNLSAGQEVFDLMTKKEVEPDVFTYTILMKGYSRVGNTKRVLELLKEMEKHGVIPSVLTFNTAIRSHAINGDLEGAQSLFERMENGDGPEPDAYTYNSLLNVCVTARALGAARQLFDEMSFSDTKQNRIAMNTMIDVYAECCNKKNGKEYLEECRKLMKELKENSGIIADKRTYSTLLKLCAGGELIDEAMEILTEMRDNHIKPDVVSYNTILDGISKNQKLSKKEVLDLSLKIFNEMKTEGVRHDVMSFTSLMNVALRLGDLHRAVRLFKEMKRRKVEPTNITYATMIKCYEKLGDPKEDGDSYLKPCVDLLAECEQAGLKLDPEGYTSLLSACANACNFDQALNIWNRMKVKKVKPNVIVFNAMINVCLSADNKDRAFDFLDQMKTSGIKPNVVTFGTFITCFIRTRDIAGAEKICKEMKIQGVEPDKSILRMLKGLGIE